MKTSVSQYAKALYEAAENKSQTEVDSVVGNFLKLLQKNGQMKLAKKIVEKFSEIYNRENGIVEAEVITKSDMGQATSDKVEKFVKEKYSAKEVILKNVVDEKIQGGIVIKVGDEMMDVSVARQISELRDVLVK